MLIQDDKLKDALKICTWWLEGCLKCESFNWDGDQREAAQVELENAKQLLHQSKAIPAPKQDPVGFVQAYVKTRGLDGYTATLNPVKEGAYALPVYLSPPPQAAAIPEYYQQEWKRNVMLMWSCVRKHDSSIPSDVLDFMREFLLSVAPKPEEK